MVDTIGWAVVDTAGAVHDLTYQTSPLLFVSRGAAGLGRAAVDNVLDKLPTAPGSAWRWTGTRPSEITIPISLRATTMGGLYTSLANLRRWFRTGDERDRALAYLRITRPQDDAVRQIGVIYAGGLEGNLDDHTPTSARVVVSLLAPDPSWTTIVDNTATYVAADIGNNLGITNPGDIDAYPIWTIHGPLANIRLLTGRAQLRLTAGAGLTLSASQTLTIDTRPSPPRTTLPIVTQDGVSHYAAVQPGDTLWTFLPGVNLYQIQATGATGATSIVLTWRPRYQDVL